MKNEMQIFSDPEFGSVRTLEIDGEPWLVGKDVAEILGYSNPSEAISEHIEQEDKLNSKTLSSFELNLGQRGGWLINESGLYSLVLSSKLPSARKFKKWVTSKVLPSIRKHGAYMTEDTLEKAVRTHCKGVSEMDIPSDGGIQKRTAERDGAPDQGGIRADREGWILKCRKKSHKKRMPAERPRGGSETEHPLNRAKVCSKKNTLRSGERPMVCPGGRPPHKSYRKRR
ncbi:MAG: Bro-N domain-containing protein [Lachnospiraceae bacterium]